MRSQLDSNARKRPFGMKERWRIAVLLAVVIVVYANALRNGFTLDDNIYIVTNPMVTHFSIRGLFAPTAYNNVFRPLLFGSFALNWAIEGARPFGYHVLDLLLHGAVTLLLYLVLKKLLESIPQGALAAWVAALLFAVHPLHTEAVDSISARSELLAMAFLLGAWLLHLSDRPILALIAFLLALLSKESAVAFVPLVLAGDYARGRGKPIFRYASVAGLAVAYMAILWKAQGGKFGEKSVSFLDNPLAHLPASLRILNALRISWKYLGLHVFPAALSCDYSYNEIPIYGNWRFGVAAALATLLVLALLALGFSHWKAGMVSRRGNLPVRVCRHGKPARVDGNNHGRAARLPALRWLLPSRRPPLGPARESPGQGSLGRARDPGLGPGAAARSPATGTGTTISFCFGPP